MLLLGIDFFSIFRLREFSTRQMGMYPEMTEGKDIKIFMKIFESSS